MALRLYLSGPIDGCSDEQMMGWRNYLKKQYPQYRYHDPCRRDYRNTHEGNEKDIVELDKFDITSSNILLAYYEKISSGTMMEIPYAFNLGKLVIVVNGTGKPFVSPWVVYHSTRVFHMKYPLDLVNKQFCSKLDWDNARNEALDQAMEFIQDQLDIDRDFSLPKSKEDRVVIE